MTHRKKSKRGELWHVGLKLLQKLRYEWQQNQSPYTDHMFARSDWYALATSLLKWVLGFHTTTFFQDEFCSLITPQIGIDIETQIEEGELFDFDVECEPVLEAWGLRLSGDVNRADLRTFYVLLNMRIFNWAQGRMPIQKYTAINIQYHI